MTVARKPIQVGSADPELKTSLIIDETDEEFETLAQAVEEFPVCYFNSITYADGEYVCSGSGELLHCRGGVWVHEGSCDPDNP